MSSPIALPRIMHIGSGAVKQLRTVIDQLGCTKPLIITDKMMVKLGYVDQLKQQIPTLAVFDETVPEPTEDSLSKAVERVQAEQFDCLIGLGGGSPIDSAKAIAILGKYGGAMKEYKVPRIVDEPGIPVIAIPTTAGTGSEATRATVITDQRRGEKMLCMGLGFLPVAALIDYELTLSLPARTTADTGIDALTHAIEAYVSRKANPYTDSQALQAMALLAPNLRTAFHEPDNRKAREAMMLGATLAGVAFSNASVALVHGMSRPIGAFFHVPHGLSNAMLLPTVTAFSIPSAQQRYAHCSRTMGVAKADDSDVVANAKLMDELMALNTELNVPTPAQFGIDKAEFFNLRQTMAEQALASGSPGNNPKIPSVQEMVMLYEQLWNE